MPDTLHQLSRLTGWRKQVSHLALACAALSAALLAVYWAGLHGSFFFDDAPSILTPAGVRMSNLSWSSLREASFSGANGTLVRPIAQISFALNHLYGGFDPFLFKLTNLFIHAGNAALVLCLLYRILPRARLTGKTEVTYAAILGTAVWALHPIQLLPVLHVVQRMASLSATFLLLGLLLHLVARESGSRSTKLLLFFTAWFVCWPLSVLSKETGLLFPYLVLTCEFFLPRDPRFRVDPFTRYLFLSCTLAVVAALVYLSFPSGHWILAGFAMRPFSLLERLLTESRVLWQYADLFFLPQLAAFALYHDDIIVSTGLLSPPTTAIALVGWAVLMTLSFCFRKSFPGAAFGIAWFLAGHALESTILPLELAHEHRNYLPSLGLAIALITTFTQLRVRFSRPKVLFTFIIATFIAYLAFITGLRAHEFGDPIRLAQMEAEYHPRSARSQSAAGSSLAKLPQAVDRNSPIYAFARYHYEKSAELSPTDKSGLLGLINLECAASSQPEQRVILELTRRLAAPQFAPGDRNVLYRLKEGSISGSNCLGRTEMDAIFDSALANPSIAPGVKAMIHSWRADYLWLSQRDARAAERSIRASLALAPGNPSNELKLAQLLFLTGRPTEAKPMLLRLGTVVLNHDETETLNELRHALNLADR